MGTRRAELCHCLVRVGRSTSNLGLEERGRAGPQGHTCEGAGGLARDNSHPGATFGPDHTLLPLSCLLLSPRANAFLHLWALKGQNRLRKITDTYAGPRKDSSRLCEVVSLKKLCLSGFSRGPAISSTEISRKSSEPSEYGMWQAWFMVVNSQ